MKGKTKRKNNDDGSTSTKSSIILPEKKFLQTNRFKEMYIPNTSWDFFDAYTSSKPCQLAFEREQVPSDNLDKYLKMTHKHLLHEYHESHKVIKRQLPPLLVELLKLQSRNGKFESLEAVSRLLGLPPNLIFKRKTTFQEWEKATAIAVAAMRQNVEYFEEIIEQHDAASQYIVSGELISDARELYAAHAATFTSMQTLPPGSLENLSSTLINQDEEAREGDDGVITDMTMVSSGKWKRKSQTEKSSDQQSASHESGTTEEGKGNPFDEDDEDEGKDGFDFSSILSKEMDSLNDLQSPTSSIQPYNNINTANANGTEEGSKPSTPMTPSKFSLRNVINQLKADYDYPKIEAQKSKLQQLETELVNLMIKIEHLVQDIISCLHRNVKAYNAAEVASDRYRTFDELTARLGNGFQPTAAYDDWRRTGCPGIRPIILSFLQHVQRIAEERLTLEELYLPGGRDWKTINNPEKNRSKWIIMWHERNIVLKVLHCLDFLRKCRELSDWYGPAYYFVGNPLMLPFPLWKVYDALRLEQLIQDQINSQPHGRVGIMELSQKDEWKHQQYLNDFRRKFHDLCCEWSFNWPDNPNLREDDVNEQYFDCLLVLFITCKDSIEKSFLWERKFITKISSRRGQDKNLIGKGNQKILREIKVPPPEMRKKRPDGIIQIDITTATVDDGAAPDTEQKAKGSIVNLPTKKKASLFIAPAPVRKTILLAEKNKAMEKSLFTVEKKERKISLMLGEKYRQSRPSQIMRNYGKEVQAGGNNNHRSNQRMSTRSPQRSTSANRLSSGGGNRPSSVDIQSSQITNETSQTTSTPSSPNQRQARMAMINNSNGKPRLTINTRATTISPFAAKRTPSSAPNSAGQMSNYVNALHPSPSTPAGDTTGGGHDENNPLEATLLSKKSGKPRLSMRLFGKDPESTGKNNQNEADREVEQRPQSRPNSRKTKIILKREDLTKELIQSRKVSRLPMPATSSTAITEDVPPSDTSLPPVKLTKRRQPSRGENKIL